MGGVVGGLLYEFVFASDASMAKVKRFILTSVQYEQGTSSDKYFELSTMKDEKETLKVIELEATV